jgi:hypothetical protein
VLVLGFALLYARTLAPGITWAHASSDSGDLITAAATLGVAHPPGYPTYLLLAHLAQYLPVGDLALRTNLLSALAALLTLLCTYHTVRGLLPVEQRWHAPFAAALATFSLGSSPLFWSQAIVTEVYTLNALFVALLLLFLLRDVQQRTNHRFPMPGIAGVCGGLALGNHLTIALPLVAWLLAGNRLAPPPQRWPLTMQRLAGIAIGALIYLYVPIRAAAHPPVNWGGATTWEGFWWLVLARPYQAMAFGVPHAFLGERLQAWASLLRDQFGIVGIVLGFVGLLYPPCCRRWVWITAAVAAGFSLFAIAYNSADSDAYLLPCYLIFAIWMGLGSAAVLAAVRQRHPRLAWLPAVLLVLLLAWPLPATLQQVDASRDYRAIAYGQRVMAAAPPAALLLTSSDRDTFTLWYMHHALGYRPDLVIIVEPLLAFEWYRHQVQRDYPTVRLEPQPAAPWAEHLTRHNPTLHTVCHTRLDAAEVLQCVQTDETIE